jgi:hypothetical protein
MNWFKRLALGKCTSCEYYSEYKTKDRLLPDKTIEKGRVVCRSCQLGDFILTDIEPCEKFKWRHSVLDWVHAATMYQECQRKRANDSQRS